VPVENSTEGAIGRTLDLLCHPAEDLREVVLRVHQHLLAQGRRHGRHSPRLHPCAITFPVPRNGSARTCLVLSEWRCRATRGSQLAAQDDTSAAIAGETARKSMPWLPSPATSRTNPTTPRVSWSSARTTPHLREGQDLADHGGAKPARAMVELPVAAGTPQRQHEQAGVAPVAHRPVEYVLCRRRGSPVRPAVVQALASCASRRRS